jgi:hypothetical protein
MCIIHNSVQRKDEISLVIMYTRRWDMPTKRMNSNEHENLLLLNRNIIVVAAADVLVVD